MAIGERYLVEEWEAQVAEWREGMIHAVMYLLNKYPHLSEEEASEFLNELNEEGESDDEVESALAVALLSDEAKARLKMALAANELLEYMSRARPTDDYYDPYDSAFGSEDIDEDWDGETGL